MKTGAGVDIVWTDGHSSHFDFLFLRDHCPCATCNDERAKKESMGGGVSLASSPLLPMYKPKARAQAATQVGNYAIQISFSDGHSTGIFSYDYLAHYCARARNAPRRSASAFNPIRCLIWNIELVCYKFLNALNSRLKNA